MPTPRGWWWVKRGVSPTEYEMELKAAPELIESVPLKGKVLTGDALYCQREICEQVVTQGGDYVLIVKGNQQELYEDIQMCFERPVAGETYGYGEQVGRHGDRVEIRRLWSTGVLGTYLSWPGHRQVCKVERIAERKGKVTRQVRYAITSLGPRTDGQKLLGFVRGQRGIENRLHYVKDVTLREDGSQIRTGSAPQVMAALRNVVLNVLRLNGETNIAAAIRKIGWQHQGAIRLLQLVPP